MDKGRIYKMISCSGPQCFFIPQNVSNAIIPVIELGANNKAEKSWNNEMIKAVCVPIRVDRLYNINKQSKIRKVIVLCSFLFMYVIVPVAKMRMLT